MFRCPICHSPGNISRIRELFNINDAQLPTVSDLLIGTSGKAAQGVCGEGWRHYRNRVFPPVHENASSRWWVPLLRQTAFTVLSPYEQNATRGSRTLQEAETTKHFVKSTTQPWHIVHPAWVVVNFEAAAGVVPAQGTAVSVWRYRRCVESWNDQTNASERRLIAVTQSKTCCALRVLNWGFQSFPVCQHPGTTHYKTKQNEPSPFINFQLNVLPFWRITTPKMSIFCHSCLVNTTDSTVIGHLYLILHFLHHLVLQDKLKCMSPSSSRVAADRRKGHHWKEAHEARNWEWKILTCRVVCVRVEMLPERRKNRTVNLQIWGKEHTWEEHRISRPPTSGSLVFNQSLCPSGSLCLTVQVLWADLFVDSRSLCMVHGASAIWVQLQDSAPCVHSENRWVVWVVLSVWAAPKWCVPWFRQCAAERCFNPRNAQCHLEPLVPW